MTSDRPHPRLYGTGRSRAWVRPVWMLITALFIAPSIGAQCPTLDTTEAANTFTITAASYFKMVFNATLSGNLDEFYDLEQDPTLDLAGGTEHRGLFYDARGTQIIINFWDDTAKTDAGKMYLLEATPTRVRIRQESFYKRLLGTAILQGIKGFGDYSVYPIGRFALRWNRRTTTSVDYRRCELVLSVHYLGSGPLSTWTPYTESGGAGFPHAGDRDFVLMKSDVPGTLTTDFLQILYKDWTVANGYQKDATETNFGGNNSGQELTTLRWRDDTSTTIPADTSEVWNFLTYFKPTNFVDHLDSAVTGRRDDYRGPDALTFNVGSAWNDSSENSTSDNFNESEAAYVLDLNPSSGLDFAIDGGTGAPPTRYQPFFKIRQWRSLQDPTSVTLNGAPLTNDTDYHADVKPVSRSHFAQDLLWHSTFQDQASVDTNPDVGGAGTVNGTTTWVAAKYGQGFLFDAAGEYVTFPSAGNFNLSQGTLEFWYQPRYAHNDGVRHVLWQNAGDASHYFLWEKTSANELKLSLVNGASTTSVTVTSANYSWRDRDWVHLRANWDVAAGAGLQARLFVDEAEPTHTDAGTYSTAGMIAGQNYVGADSAGSNSATGIIDELSVYDAPSGPTPLAYGGLTANADEYLASATRNASLPFVAINGQKQGEYFYVGADSEFRGLNVDFPPSGGAGVGNSPVLQWQYWNGTGWSNLTLSGDQTNSFTQRGTLYWTDPADWSLYSVNGGPDLYYVRAHLASGDYATQAPTEGMIKTDILLFQYCADITASGQNFVFGVPTPTAVELSSFSAEGRDAMVAVSWETASELDNLGFHLYRAETEEGPYERITANVIPGLGSSANGARYGYRDVGLTNGVTYYYRLEDIDTRGTTESHGPVSATPEAEGDSGEQGSTPWEEPGDILIYGNPEANRFEVSHWDEHGATLELVTEGFYAAPMDDGTVRLHIPGFQLSSEKNLPSIPVMRPWVDAIPGRDVSIVTVEQKSIARFAGLRPTGAATELVAGANGVARLLTRRRPAALPREGFYPAVPARVMAMGFQGETRKVQLELAPLRWEAGSQTLVLSRRLEVRLSFRPDPGEDSRARWPRDRFQRRTSSVLVRLATRQSGLHEVRYEDVFGPNSRQEISAGGLSLSRLGEPVAFWIEPPSGTFGPGSRLYFVSESPRANPYQNELVYELARRPGTLMRVAAASPSGADASFYRQRVEREVDRFYQAGLLEAPDPWLWDVVMSRTSRRYAFEIEGLTPSGEPSRLSVRLQGASDFPASPDHHVRMLVNGSFVKEASWDGKEPFRLDAELGPGVVREGENWLELENLGDTGAAYSMVFLDRFEVLYPRTPRATEGRLEGSWSLSGTANVSSVNPAAYVLDVSGDAPLWLSEVDRAVSGEVRFRVQAGHQYLVVSPESVLHPGLRRPAPVRLKLPLTGADYLVLGPRAFLDEVEPLLRLRRRQGLRTRAVALEQVYEEFGFGESRPEALRDFLSYAYHHWSDPSLHYVVLAGDGTYDYKDYLATGVVNRVPAMMVKTSFLWTASDPMLVSVNGEDPLPDLAIGRLPAATESELRVMVDKILAYESAGPAGDGGAPAPVVLITDNPDLAGDFVADAEEIAAGVLSGYRVQKLHLSELGPVAMRSAIRDAFDNGSSLMSYMGHGGIHVWASEDIFDTGDLASLRLQERQPILLTLNCLSGYFHFPYFDSLSEGLLKAEGKGVIAAFSPTGLSLNAAAHQFHQILLREIFHRKHERLGDAVLAAQEAYAASGAFPELLLIYHLLGDPALSLH